MKIKPLWWKFFITISSTIYLIPEIIFNTQLVTIVGSGLSSIQETEQLELFGRGISGVGVTLLLLGLIPLKWTSTVLRTVFSTFMAFILIWPMVFFGQKLLVDKLLIDPSTAMDRQRALVSSTLRGALANNTIQVEGINFDPEHQNNSSDLTFIVLFSSLIYADSTLGKKIEAHKEDIVSKYVKKRVDSGFEDYFEEYRELHDTLSDIYTQYSKGIKKYNKTISEIGVSEKDAWHDVQDNIEGGWSEYVRAQTLQQKKADDMAKQYRPSLNQYFENLNTCHKKKNKNSRKRCTDRLDSHYKKRITKLGYGYIPPSHWLTAKNVSTMDNIVGSVVGGVLTGGAFTILQTADVLTGGNGGFSNKKYYYDNSINKLSQRMLAIEKVEHQFIQRTGGYPSNIRSLDEFKNHTLTQQKAVQAIRKQGLNVSDNMSITNRSIFQKQFGDAYVRNAKETTLSILRNKRLPAKLNLSWDQFVLQEEIQNNISNKMGEYYIENMYVGWNRKNFYNNVMIPNIKKETKRYLQLMKASENDFRDGGKYEIEGKDSLRSVMVPPISMAISLFLLCITTMTLPLKYYEAFVGIKISMKSSILMSVVSATLLLVAPITLFKNLYISNNDSTVNYFINNIEQNAGFTFSFAIKWTMHLQPVIHPIGDFLESKMGIYSAFGSLSHTLNGFDEKVFDSIKTQNMTQSILYVKSNVSNPRIRIMNIKEKYHSGIILKPGLYDIEVTQRGYKKYREWHRIHSGDNELHITLSK